MQGRRFRTISEFLLITNGKLRMSDTLLHGHSLDMRARTFLEEKFPLDTTLIILVWSLGLRKAINKIQSYVISCISLSVYLFYIYRSPTQIRHNPNFCYRALLSNITEILLSSDTHFMSMEQKYGIFVFL